MKLEFLPSALNAYKALKGSRPEYAAKVKEMLRDALEHPDAGMGEPTRLSGRYGRASIIFPHSSSIFFTLAEVSSIHLSILSSRLMLYSCSSAIFFIFEFLFKFCHCFHHDLAGLRPLLRSYDAGGFQMVSQPSGLDIAYP